MHRHTPLAVFTRQAPPGRFELPTYCLGAKLLELTPQKFHQKLNEYGEWLKNSFSGKHAKYCYYYAQKYYYVLVNPSLTATLKTLTPTTRHQVLLALTNLSKFLGVYEEWRQVMKQYNLKWEVRKAGESFRALLEESGEINNYVEWLKEVLPTLPRKYREALVFLSFTGMRPSEGCEARNLLIELQKTGGVQQYFSSNTLMHFKYESMFARRTKNAFISFIDEEAVRECTKSGEKVSSLALRLALRRRKLPQHLKNGRKWFATLMIQNGLLPSEVDLLEGRIERNILYRHYLRTNLDELKGKVLKIMEPYKQLLYV